MDSIETIQHMYKIRNNLNNWPHGRAVRFLCDTVLSQYNDDGVNPNELAIKCDEVSPDHNGGLWLIFKCPEGEVRVHFYDTYQEDIVCIEGAEDSEMEDRVEKVMWFMQNEHG